MGARGGILLAGLLLLATPSFAQVGGLTELPAARTASQNLLTNGGFEKTGGGDGLAGWTGPRDGESWAIDDRGRSGSSLRLAIPKGARGVPQMEQPVTLQPGTYALEGWLKLESLGDPRSGVRICLDGRPRLQWWKCTDIARGTADWRAHRQSSIVVDDAGAYKVTVGPYGRPDGSAWFDDVSLTVLRAPALEAYLLYPNFRGLLFDDRPQTVRLAVSVAEPAADRRVRVSLTDEAGAAVRAQREYPAARATTAELDAAALPVGTYRVRTQLLGPGGEVVAGHPDYRVVKAPAKSRDRYTVWIDEHNTTHLHGRPSFIIGLYHTTGFSTAPQFYARGHDGWGNERIAQAPVNMMINYWLGAAPVAALDAYMDDLVSRGIFYLQTVNFYQRDNPLYAKLPYPAAKEGEDALNRYVAATLSKHKGLAGFYTADERPADVVPQVFRQYRTLRETAPGTVAYAVLGDGWEKQAPLWRDVVDVLGLDPYPLTKPRGQNDLAMVGEWTRLGRDAVHGSRPLWMVLQYFPVNAAAGWPTYDELRSMSWMAIVEGARGLLYWSFGNRGLAWVKDPAEREARWNDLVRVTREVKALESVLLAPDAALLQEAGGLPVLGKRLADGTRYLFAYNPKNAPAAVTWRLKEPGREAADLDGGAIALGDGGVSLRVELPPFGVKRIRVK
jgi:hypothetical protein